MARIPAGHRTGAALRLPRARAARSPARPALRRIQAAARPVRQGGRGRPPLGRVAVRLPVRQPDQAEHLRQRVAHAQERGDQPVLRLGQRPGPADPVPRDDHLRGPRARADPVPPGGPGGAARHLRRAGPSGGHRAPAAARRDRGRADAGAPVRGREVPGRARPDQLLGLQHDRLPGPAQPLFLSRPARRAGRRVQVDGQGAARGGHRGHPRRGVQPHRGGRPHGARRCPSAASTTPPTTGCRTPSAGATWTTPAAATA